MATQATSQQHIATDEVKERFPSDRHLQDDIWNMASLFESLKVRKIKKKPGSECWRSTKMVVGMGAHDRGERLRGLGLF